MTLAISKALEEGAKAVVCASTGNTQRLGRRLRGEGRADVRGARAARARSRSARWPQTLVHGARMLEVDGNFDASLELAQDLADRYPVTLVNSVNPFRLAGQKTAAFEICDALGRAPDIHCVPVGNAGNISSHWLGYSEYLARRRDPRAAAAVRVPGGRRGAASCTGSRSRTRRRSRPRSGSGTRPRGTRRSRPRPQSEGAIAVRHRPRRSWPPIAGWRARDSSPSPRAPRASPACSNCTRTGRLPAGAHGRVHPDRATA